MAKPQPKAPFMKQIRKTPAKVTRMVVAVSSTTTASRASGDCGRVLARRVTVPRLLPGSIGRVADRQHARSSGFAL
jgi:hypothetical protein